jgi:hypothetical protein
MEDVHVRIKKTFPTKNQLPQFKGCSVLIGTRVYTHADGPFPVHPNKAKELVEQGLADIVTKLPELEQAIMPAREKRSA